LRGDYTDNSELVREDYSKMRGRWRVGRRCKGGARAVMQYRVERYRVLFASIIGV
jgi:hypothetical protein